MSQKLTLNEKRLVRRYLVWCYKTTKEQLDRVDRKLTQLLVDRYMLKDLKRGHEEGQYYSKPVKDFQEYIRKKEEEASKQKFDDSNQGELQPSYLYLQRRLQAVESSIVFFLGEKELPLIEKFYEEEMTRRILESREH